MKIWLEMDYAVLQLKFTVNKLMLEMVGFFLFMW